MASDPGHHDGSRPHDGARYLTGSPVRVEILRTLRQEPCRPAALTDAVDATRTTVQRVLAGYRERRWVVKRDAAYHVTATGERVHDAYESLLADIDRADRYGEFAADMKRASAGFPASGLDSGTLTAATERDPLAALDRVVELLRVASGSSIRAVSPIVTTQYNEAAASALDAGSDVELVIDRDVLATSMDEFGPATDRALDDDDASVYVTERSIEYGFFRYDDRACVIAYDENNNPRYVLESTAPSVLDWADSRFDALVVDATPLSAVLERA
ncbi:helix-turn-helix transcriptional regulator [Halorubrum tibetense]|uniref:Helix-turn-helix transcriptional regulator n=1 Tax=Halorubrum tibetense TaxID=175631 RepID=A0ABD5S8J9_9EURY